MITIRETCGGTGGLAAGEGRYTLAKFYAKHREGCRGGYRCAEFARVPGVSSDHSEPKRTFFGSVAGSIRMWYSHNRPVIVSNLNNPSTNLGSPCPGVRA